MHRLPVIVIDYVSPGDRARAREIAERIKALGFIPWVANASLDMLGVGAVEVVPRKILMLYNSGRDEQSLSDEYVAAYGAMPLNWLGYVPVYHEVSRGSLPGHPLAGRYAGIVTWFQDNLDRNAQPVGALLQRARDEGVRIAVLGQFGIPPGNKLNATFAVDSRSVPTPAMVQFGRRDGLGYEFDPIADHRSFFALTTAGADAPVRLLSDRGDTMDAIAYTAWGGYALDPYVITELSVANRARWALEPFEFFRRALDLRPLPMPDVTTENGRRLLLTHIDGDGFASRAEFTPDWAPRSASLPGRQGTFAAEVLLREVLERYRIPTTMSVIQGEVALNGLFPSLSGPLENIARNMFRLPHVEIGSHSYSHPFRWGAAAAGNRNEAILPIRNYRFDLATEVDGSIRYIEERLAPPGKKVRLFQWTGDCNPGADALQRVQSLGIGNMNGGNTLISRAEPSVTLVSPLGLPKGSQFQVFAPNQNENRYTNGFRGPFAGYQRVIETFEMTDSPRRLKPINIYYHTFSASKRASLAALQRVYDWSLAQQPHPIHASEYVAKVQDFNRMVIARSGNGYLVRSAGDLRTLRIPVATDYPDLAASKGVAGFADHEGARYLHLAGDEAYVAFTSTPPKTAMLTFANGRIEKMVRTNAIRAQCELHKELQRKDSPMRSTMQPSRGWRGACAAMPGTRFARSMTRIELCFRCPRNCLPMHGSPCVWRQATMTWRSFARFSNRASAMHRTQASMPARANWYSLGHCRRSNRATPEPGCGRNMAGASHVRPMRRSQLRSPRAISMQSPISSMGIQQRCRVMTGWRPPVKQACSILGKRLAGTRSIRIRPMTRSMLISKPICDAPQPA